MENHIVKKSIQINAQPLKVWDALTNPEKTKKYFYNAEVHSDWKAGSEITFKGKMFLIINYEMHGKILSIEPGKLLKYTLKNGKADDTTAGFSTVTDELSYDRGVTTISITDDVGAGEGAEKRYNRSQKGWDKILSKLKKIAEGS
jgi:uncharacterized protein YndB with AHSA1/START domain